jgi:type I restriction-modification system DNA methylase subunit
MVLKERVLDILGYTESPNYRRLKTDTFHPMTAHLFRAARKAGAEGAYLFQTDRDERLLPSRPAVFIAEASNEEQAREIHGKLWNLGNSPFLIVILPKQVRVYTGFDYKEKDKTRGLLDSIGALNDVELRNHLADYTADAIDSGDLWRRQGERLTPDRRVDVRLLKNLKDLETKLTKTGLDLKAAHALIGKYVYIRYLSDRGVLSEKWLAKHEINIESVLERDATLTGLRTLTDKLDDLFNGHIFPFPEKGSKLTDEHVRITARAFNGDDVASGQAVLFERYDFSYIPVEMLSAIYEQFLDSQGKAKRDGAVYTPEHLADYLLAEVNSVQPLKKGMKILDPCCGSGVFLVLAYRKLIESEIAQRSEQKESMRPSELRAILTDRIFGVERNEEACRVTELSLILTMLHYVDPPELHRNPSFQFPDLHNRQIFNADFFDDSSDFHRQGQRFDWIVGNPPWIEPKKSDEAERLALLWMEKNKKIQPTAGNRVAEAFSWRVRDFLSDEGCAGLILPATSLFNHESQNYRQEFFKQNEVLRITNFANLRHDIFQGSVAPFLTATYRKASLNKIKRPIIHYGPFAINQFLNGSQGKKEKRRSWALTVNENEISTVSSADAETGNALTWKLTLWGNHRDKRTLEKLKRLFPETLGNLITMKVWFLHQGIELRRQSDYKRFGEAKITPVPDLEGKIYFDAKAMIKSKYQFSVPKHAFQIIPSNRCFIHNQGSKASIRETGKAHILFNAAYSIFSDEDFILQSPDKRLSAPLQDSEELKALSVFCSSSVIKYFLFFHNPGDGIERPHLYKKDIEKIPVPRFEPHQIQELVSLRAELVAKENVRPNDSSLQDLLDDEIERILKIPKNISLLAREFVRIRLQMDAGKQTRDAGERPSRDALMGYGETLRNELDAYAEGRLFHKISLTPDQNLIVCEVEITKASTPRDVVILQPDAHSKAALKALQEKLKQRFSQWVYIQRGLRVFDGSKAYILKTPHLLHWTRTQALLDSDDFIAEALSRGINTQEATAHGGS